MLQKLVFAKTYHLKTWNMVSDILYHSTVKAFFPNAPFLYPVKTLKNLMVF